MLQKARGEIWEVTCFPGCSRGGGAPKAMRGDRNSDGRLG